MKKIVILGSTGSIGKSLLKIINKDKKLFKIKLLTAHKNYKQLLLQAKLFNVKNVILTHKKTFNLKKKIFSKNKISIFNNFSELDKILNNKVDYVMSSIVGLDGLEPTLKLIKFTKIIAIANKESIICGWNLINKELKNYNTNFIPVDSEHFSIWHALDKKIQSSNIYKIYLTASGGPLLNLTPNKINKIKINHVTKHPNWKMGKKISVDSATLMNKVFEVIEAKKIFSLTYEQINVLIHPVSYVHAIVEFRNRMISIIAHDTTMEIPIFNTLNLNKKNKRSKDFNDINLIKLNNLSLKKVNKVQFPAVKILKTLPKNNSLFETALVVANDQLVDLYLKKKIEYKEIIINLFKIINSKDIMLLKRKIPKNIDEIFKINDYVRSKIKKMSI